MRDLLGRTLHDIAQIFESVEASEERIVRVLELVERIVPYERCALLRAQSGRQPRLLVVPATPMDVRVMLSETLIHLHRRLVDERVHPLLARAKQWGAHLAVPLVENSTAIGVLFVSGGAPDGSDGAYTEQHLRDLSIVGSHLAGYLVMVEQARELDEARRKAEEANRMKDAFLALISHELKAERNVISITKLVDEILDLACVLTANLRLHVEAAEPARLIKAAVEEQRPLAEQRSIRLETALDESIDRLIVDPARIVQVISNLLAKAIQFTPSGGQVGIRLARVGARARIQVIDCGRGIAPEVSPDAFDEGVVASIGRLGKIPAAVLPHVLETFRAGKNPVTRAYGELGVELAIVKALVEAHGGCVRAEDLGEDEGSAFTLELPLPAEVPEVGQRLLEGIRVLLVDDDEDMRRNAGAVLEHQGAEVTAVASAAAALAAIERSIPHVLISDISMPGKSGYELMREVAARDATLPAAALTGFGTAEDRAMALAAGFQMHLVKPLEADALVTAVATLTGRPLAKSMAIMH
jgi:signal transduction histidine kinase/CheY-like chemotaxis protein